MIKFVALLLSPFLSLRPIRRVRRNHGLEHATIHMLSRKKRGLSMAGRSVIDGFILYGNASTEEVHAAVEEALRRMRSGEHNLAVHPNCGTGLVTAGFMTSMATLLGTAGIGDSWSQKLSRLPSLILLSVIAIIISQPMGMSLQRHITTLGDPGDLELVEIATDTIKSPMARSGLNVHRVWTRAG